MPYVFAITVLAILLGYANSRYSVGQEVIQRAGFGQRTMMDWWVGNASDVVEWFRAYAIVIGLAIVAGIAIVLIRRQALGIIALIGFGISAGTYLFAPSTAYPRYYLPALAFGCLLAGLCLDLIWRTLPKYVVDRESKQAVLSLIMLIPLFSTVEFLLFVYPSYIAPAQLRLATVDRQQHITLWSSGYGIREAMQYVSEQAKKRSEPSIVYVSDLAGNGDGAIVLDGQRQGVDAVGCDDGGECGRRGWTSRFGQANISTRGYRSLQSQLRRARSEPARTRALPTTRRRQADYCVSVET